MAKKRRVKKSTATPPVPTPGSPPPILSLRASLIFKAAVAAGFLAILIGGLRDRPSMVFGGLATVSLAPYPQFLFLFFSKGINFMGKVKP
jgi:hypothetical protein